MDMRTGANMDREGLTALLGFAQSYSPPGDSDPSTGLLAQPGAPLGYFNNRRTADRNPSKEVLTCGSSNSE